jgi:hypothetical protein
LKEDAVVEIKLKRGWNPIDEHGNKNQHWGRSATRIFGSATVTC